MLVTNRDVLPNAIDTSCQSSGFLPSVRQSVGRSSGPRAIGAVPPSSRFSPTAQLPLDGCGTNDDRWVATVAGARGPVASRLTTGRRVQPGPLPATQDDGNAPPPAPLARGVRRSARQCVHACGGLRDKILGAPNDN
jgi:hypothetical protein